MLRKTTANFQGSRKLGRHYAYLSIVGGASREQSIERVVSRNGEANEVDKKLARNVEEDKEEEDQAKAEERIGLRHRRLLLEVVESWIFGQLGLISLSPY